MVALSSIASQHRLVVRRMLYVAAGSAALVAAPQLLDRLPPYDECSEMLRATRDNLQARQVVHICGSQDSTFTI